MTRISALRTALALPQAAFGDLIGLSQGRVSQLEAGTRESRSISRLLDVLAEKHGLSHLTAAAFAAAPASPGPTPVPAPAEGAEGSASPAFSSGGAA